MRYFHYTVRDITRLPTRHPPIIPSTPYIHPLRIRRISSVVTYLQFLPQLGVDRGRGSTMMTTCKLQQDEDGWKEAVQ